MPTAEEDGMGRKFIDCREYPSEMNCTVALSADSDEELLEAAVQHAVIETGSQASPRAGARAPNCVTACYFFLPRSSFAPVDFRGLSTNDAWAVVATLGFSSFGFLASRFSCCWPFAIAILL